MKQLFTFILIIIISHVNAQNPLLIPPTIESTNINLTLQNGTYSFLPGQITNTMGANGNILAPTLIVNNGDNLNINITNNLGEPTTIHWHGLHISAENDGGPHTVIDPGATWNPQFTVDNKAATYWYHPHLHEFTDEHVSKGLAGLMIVRDAEEAALNLPRTYGVDDIPLVIQTKDFDANNQIVSYSNTDDVLMVNATLDPMVDVPAQIVRLRILNGSSQRVFNLGLSGNQIFYQIATDGGLKTTSTPLTRLLISPGERSEILVDLNGMQGQTLQLMSYAAELGNGIYGSSAPGMNSNMPLTGYAGNALNGANFNILQLNVVAQTASPITSIPSMLAIVTPHLESNSNQSRTMTLRSLGGGFNQLNGNFTINSVSMDMNVINVTIPLNNTEIWTIENNSPIAHPFHIHDIQFYIIEYDGSTNIPAYLQGWKDTVLVLAGQSSVKVIMKFEDFADENIPYMYHCHMLTHEDGGMMGQFVVIDPTANVNAVHFENGLKIYPNPSSQVYVTAELEDKSEKITSLAVVNSLGQIVSYQKIDVNELSNRYSLPIFEFASGIYTLKVYSSSKIYSRKFVIK